MDLMEFRNHVVEVLHCNYGKRYNPNTLRCTDPDRYLTFYYTPDERFYIVVKGRHIGDFKIDEIRDNSHKGR